MSWAERNRRNSRRTLRIFSFVLPAFVAYSIVQVSEKVLAGPVGLVDGSEPLMIYAFGQLMFHGARSQAEVAFRARNFWFCV